MTSKEIIALVMDVAKVNIVGLRGKQDDYTAHARYVAILMMHHESIDQITMAKALETNRCMPGKVIDTIKRFLDTRSVNDTRSSAQFKYMFLKCQKRLAEMEDGADAVFEGDFSPKLNNDFIIRQVEGVTGMKHQEDMETRCFCAYFLCNYGNERNYTSIGKALNIGRTSVYYQVEKVERGLNIYRHTRQLVGMIKRAIGIMERASA